MITFHEDGLICEVDILEDTSDKRWYRYKLSVKRIIQESPIFKSPEIGKEFSVTQVKEGSWAGMWLLEGYNT